MEELEQRILKEGLAKAEGGVVLVSSFLNHQLDPQLMMHCAEEFARLFNNQGINKIVTIESSGIAPAIMTGYLMNLPVVFIKKKSRKRSMNLGTHGFGRSPEAMRPPCASTAVS